MTDKNENLTAEQEQLIGAYMDGWLRRAGRTVAIDRTAFEESIASVCALEGRRSPIFVWFEDPWEVVAMQVVLFALWDKAEGSVSVRPGSTPRQPARSRRWMETFLRTLFTDKYWTPVWNRFDEHRETIYNFLSPFDWEHSEALSTQLDFPMSSDYYEIKDRFSEIYSNDVWEQLYEIARANFRSHLRAGLEHWLRAFAWRDLTRSFPGRVSRILKEQLRSQYIDEKYIDCLNSIRTNGSGRAILLEKLRTMRFVPSLSPERTYVMQRVSSVITDELEIQRNLRFLGWEEMTVAVMEIAPALMPKDFELITADELTRLSFWRKVIEQSFAISPVGPFLLCSERPQHFEVDRFDLLHSETGLGLDFKNGRKWYFWHGNSVPGWIIEEPHLITLEKIKSERNITVRRVLIERYGEAKYLMDSGALVIDDSQYGTLYTKTFDDDERLVMLKVLNSTLGPDGEAATYFLRVPSNIVTAKQAVAWTFSMEEEEYSPSVES